MRSRHREAAALCDIFASRVNDDTVEHAAAAVHVVQGILEASRELLHGLSFPELNRLERNEEAPLAQGIPRASFHAILARAARELGDPELGLTLGQRVSASDFGLAGQLILHSVDVRSAVEMFLLLRRTRLGGPAWRAHEEGGELRLGHPLSGEPTAARVEADLGMTLAYKTALHFLGPRARRSLRVELAYPEPADATRYTATFGPAVSFGHTLSALVVPRSLMDQPRPGSDPRFSQDLRLFAWAYCAARDAGSSWSRALPARLRAASSPARVRDLSAKLGMSERTLRRRLEEEGTSFRVVRDQLRLDQALTLLQTTSLSVKEIADRVGFAQTNSFRRRFRRWRGVTPSSYRRVISRP